VRTWARSGAFSSAADGRIGFTLRASGHPARNLHADRAFSLLRFKLGAPFARAASDCLASAIPSGAKLRDPGDDVTWRYVRKTPCRKDLRAMPRVR
jgi:hypothetical protein